MAVSMSLHAMSMLRRCGNVFARYTGNMQSLTGAKDLREGDKSRKGRKMKDDRTKLTEVVEQLAVQAMMVEPDDVMALVRSWNNWNRSER
jgi:hypothetical protein